MNTSKTPQVNPKPTVIPLDKPILAAKKDKSALEWKHVDWRKLEKRVYKLHSENLQSLSL